MSCDKVRTQLTAYLDGELGDDRGSAVRGHLRTCEGCRTAAADEAVLRDGLRALPGVDVPASLWAGVQARLAQEEMADAEKPAWRRALARWMPKAPQLAFGAAVAAAAIVLVVVRMHHSSEQTIERDRTVTAPMQSQQVVIAAQTQTQPTAEPPTVGSLRDDDRDVTEALAAAPAGVTGEYAAAARELLPLAQETRAGWSSAQQHEFDARVAELQHSIDTAKDDRHKQREYRTLIRFLQHAALRDDVVLASTGGVQ